ncbi:MAG: Co2+/Mg2+ efflux protein ApaG [Bacteroidia bacterium]|nr:Co2+/Mg2+ efflux protein ApaG [Bacteroidia bacterium]
MTRSITEGVEISVDTRFLDDHSNPMDRFYFFLYTITIENKNDFTVQLLRRHWYIFDSNGEKREVEGEGVVGETPVLEAGEKYTYSSGCNLMTEMGKMRGIYSMNRLLDNKSFEVTIPEFLLIAPQKLN